MATLLSTGAAGSNTEPRACPDDTPDTARSELRTEPHACPGDSPDLARSELRKDCSKFVDSASRGVEWFGSASAGPRLTPAILSSDNGVAAAIISRGTPTSFPQRLALYLAQTSSRSGYSGLAKEDGEVACDLHGAKRGNNISCT